jgi:hypothetical protein
VAGATLALGLTLTLGGCDDIFDVTLPASLTGEALDDPIGAVTQVNSVIVMFENSMSNFKYTLHGHEDGGEVVLMSPSIGQGIFGYTATAPDFTASIVTGTTPPPAGGFMQARLFASNLHEKLDKSWTTAQVPLRARYLAISSMYEGAVYAWMGATLCEGAVNGGKMLTQAEMYALADQTLTRAITEIGAAGGDFAMPFGIATSALQMTYGFRAQNRWMSGDLAGAKADAERVPNRFYAYMTRENTATRRNLNFYNGPSARFASLQGVVDWWQSATFQPNPANGQRWPTVIPFTGYTDLGILPDGRAVRDDGLPIRLAGPAGIPALAEKYRQPGEDAAVADTRVPWITGIVGGKSTITFIATKWPNCAVSVCGNFGGGTGEAAYIPLVNWKEMMLIRAEAEGGQGAIDRVNEIRTADGLPRVTYLAATNTQGIRRMIIEERRRTLFQEGRYYYTKLKNLDLLWFPRLQGRMPTAGTAYQGGVRMAMPDTEYQLNANIADLNKRGSGCDAASRPSF